MRTSVTAIVTASFLSLALLAGCSSSSGSALVDQKCSGCHGVAAVLNQKYDRATWDQAVAQMRTRGVTMTDAEAAQIATFLANR